MARSDNKGVAQALTAATCALLGTSTTEPARAQDEHSWEFDTAFLFYGESDDRVQDLSLTLTADRLFADDKLLRLGLVVDSLTGATPSGALPLDVVQTFTRPSGESTFDVGPDSHPLDDTFLDTRYALSVSWQQPLGRLYRGNAGMSFSREYDYTHAGVNFGLSRDFNKRNTTLSLGVALASDDLDPEGGVPIPLSPMLEVGDLSNRQGSDSKDVLDVLLGVTQVINRNFLVQANYSFSDSSGYLNDPYRILSLVNPLTGDTLPRSGTPGIAGPSHEFRYESRPDSRRKHSLFGQGKYFFAGKVLDVSYRYMTDDWEIDSHTLDTRLRIPLGERSYIEPHVRYYTQTQADFYRLGLTAGNPLPLHASPDYRLAEFDAMTAGVKYGWTTERGREFSLRLEYYRQEGDPPAEQVIGNQAGRDLYPGLDAVIFNFGYGFGL